VRGKGIGLLAQIRKKREFGLKFIFVDKAYDSEKLYKINLENNNLLYTDIRIMTTKKPNRFYFRKQKKSFDKSLYNLGRNPVEMIIFLLKNIGFTVRARKIRNKIKQVAWKILGYNIEQLARAIKLFYSIMIQDKAELMIIFKYYI
jgi:hypothetical protein